MIEVTGCGVELSLRRQSISGRCSDGEGSWLNFYFLICCQSNHICVCICFLFAIYYWQLLKWRRELECFCTRLNQGVTGARFDQNFGALGDSNIWTTGVLRKRWISTWCLALFIEPGFRGTHQVFDSWLGLQCPKNSQIFL